MINERQQTGRRRGPQLMMVAGWLAGCTNICATSFELLTCGAMHLDTSASSRSSGEAKPTVSEAVSNWRWSEHSCLNDCPCLRHSSVFLHASPLHSATSKATAYLVEHLDHFVFVQLLIQQCHIEQNSFSQSSLELAGFRVILHPPPSRPSSAPSSALAAIDCGL